MSLAEIQQKKIQNKTAIPSGTYEVALSFSNRFQRLLPELKDVPGYVGVRIHNGNTAAETDGFILAGSTKAADFVGNSKSTTNTLISKLSAVNKTEKITLVIS